VDLYEQIAADYSQITGEQGRVGPARAFLTELRRRHPFSSVLDVACGTGLHAVMLAEMGASVTAADISAPMLDLARVRAASASASAYLAPGDSPGAPGTPEAPRASRAPGISPPIRFLQSPMQDLAGILSGPFDAILCLGNSLPHLLEPADLRSALAGFARLLAPRGVVVLQLLNYARILARRERIVGVTRGGQDEFIRFYDFLDGLVRFNVLTLRWRDARCQHELASALLRPYTAADLAPSLRAAGLPRIALHAGLAFAPFDEQESDTLMILAGKE
jgi:glycine/sarcosine N-methyltransferase